MSHSEVSAAQSMLLSLLIALYLLTETIIHTYVCRDKYLSTRQAWKRFKGTDELSPGHRALRPITFRLPCLLKIFAGTWLMHDY